MIYVMGLCLAAKVVTNRLRRMIKQLDEADDGTVVALKNQSAPTPPMNGVIVR